MKPKTLITLAIVGVGVVVVLLLRPLLVSNDPHQDPVDTAALPMGAPGETAPSTEVKFIPSDVDVSPTARAEVELEAVAPPEPIDSLAGWNVTVVNEAGLPVEGALVNLVAVIEHMGGRTKRLLVSSPTDREGRTFVEDQSATFSDEQRLALVESQSTMRLVPVGLFGAADERKAAGLERHGAAVTTGENSPPVDVTLVRPDTGTVRLEVHSPNGPIPGGFSVYLTEGWKSLLEGTALVEELPAGAAVAVLEFSNVGLDRKLEAEALGPAGAKLGKCSFEGPKIAGATVEAVLELSFGTPRLIGRVLSPLDAPLKATLTHKPTLSSTLSTRRLLPMGEIEVDELGHFDVEVPWLSFDGPRNATLRLSAGDDPDRVHETILRVRPQDPILDLGAFYLEPLPIVIAGRVANQQGEGVVTKLDMIFRRPAPTEGEEAHWGRFTQTLESGADGRFVHRGALPDGIIWLSVESDTHVLGGGEGTILEFPSGTEDAELLVFGQGWLSADASALAQSHLSHFYITAWQGGADDEAIKATRQSFSVKNGPRFGPFIDGPLHVELDAWGVGTLASWDIVLVNGETHGLGVLTTDRPLYPHTVVFDTVAKALRDAPMVFGKTATRTILARKRGNGLRHTFLTTEPLVSLRIQPAGGHHDPATATQYDVTGVETRIPWE
ncbi:MAG: hypothetical protein ACJAQ3_001371 [Planctomycetota bacterium]|jgi:hypothetical protein